MPADSFTTPTLHRRASLLAALFLLVVGGALGAGAWQLARAQSRDRADLRDRYASRATVASALVDSLFRLAFQQAAADAAKTYAHGVTDAQMQARVRQNRSLYAATLNADGKLVAGSKGLPARLRSGAEARLHYFQAALRGQAATGISDVLNDGPSRQPVIETAVRFKTASGTTRILVTASSQRVFGGFLGGSLKPLTPVEGGDAYVLDSTGRPLAAVSAGTKQPRPPDRRLIVESARRQRGTYDANGEKFFSVAGLPNTRWRIVIAAPTSELYGPANGTSRWLPWVVLVLCAIALLAIAALIRRTLVARARLAVANAELERSQDRLRERAAELQKSNTELQRSNADLEQFAYVASHDLSAPLRAVAGFSQLLAARYRGRLDSDADEFIRHMQEGVDRMQRIIDDLLAYSRVDRSDLTAESVDLGQVLDDVLTGLGPDIAASHAKVTRDGLPTVRGERGQLGQVLQNLIANGIKFTAPGVTPQVHVAAAQEDGCWRIEVRDNGIGIEPEHADRIFKMFQRLHGPEDYPGTGIGLAISKKIVERHGGRLFVEPGPNGGSTFVFTVQNQVRAAVR